MHGSNSVRPGGRNGGAAGPRQLPRTLPFIPDLDPPTLLSPLFGRIITELARGYQVIAFDNRGAGRTEKPDTPYTICDDGR